MNKAEEKKDNETYAKHFTRVPNILFESYRYLTKEEVLLYIRLRYVYWDTKPRYLSLRELADRTGYSTGALSKMLPRLHKVGLIHAEIRRKISNDGKEKGNPVYHLTINDIWEENRRFFTEGNFDPSEVLLVHEMNVTRSPNEQDRPEPVHQMNKPVHKTNDLVHQMEQGRSEDEQDYAQVERGNTLYKTSNNTSRQECITSSDEDVLALSSEELHDKVDGAIIGIETVKRITDEHKAIKLSENDNHSQDEDDTPTAKREAVKIGATTYGLDRRSGPDDLPRGASSGSADARDRADDARPGHAATAPVARVIPKRPRGKKLVTMPEPAPKFDLTPEQQHFWSLWCGVWFNQDIPPELTETAYKHVGKLAPHITSEQDMNSLIDYTRKELQESQGIRRKAVQLGNCVNSYRGWKQVQREEPPPTPEEEGEFGHSDFDRYVGNGPEEREKLYLEGLERERNGTLIW